MAFLETKHEKKSFIITVVIYILLILLLFFFGLKYLDPPPESGIAINFGTSEVGMGAEQPTEPVQSAPQESTPPPVEQVEQEEVVEEVVTQDNIDAPSINEEEEERTPLEVEEPVEEEPEEVEEPDPQPDESTTDALNSILNAPKNEGETQGSEGDDNTAGDKGDPNGDPKAGSYYGSGQGLDGDGNYRLGGRRALNKEKFVQDCNESGIVVVEIEVDRSGKVISAKPGIKGSTNTSSCLTEPARRAALATKFNSDPDAPATQTGTIRYNFKLSE